jgi:hypothetical protein
MEAMMKTRRLFSMTVVCSFTLAVLILFLPSSEKVEAIIAEASPTPVPSIFDQKAAVAKLREQIKGREQEPASAVFKNIQTMKNRPAGQLLSVMELGFARSLGVDCMHCHVPDKWESEKKPQKQIARDMYAMAAKINGEMLKNIKNLKSETPTINCTTCHRGEVKPALNLSPPESKPKS